LAESSLLSGAQLGLSIVQQLDKLAECFRPYEPEVRRFRIDYLDKGSEIKYLIRIPSGLSRKLHRKVSIPSTIGFKIDEIIDLDTTQLLSFSYNSSDKTWNFDADQFPNSERFLITLKGRVSEDFLARLVSVRVATDASRQDGIEKFWVHSALRDVSILQRVWNELDLDRVNCDVRIGVERLFTSVIPNEVRNALQTQKQLLDAIAHGARNIEGLKSRYRVQQRRTKVSPAELFELVMKLVSGDFVIDYIRVSSPYVLGLIEPVKALTAIVPEKLKVGVQTDLNFQVPVAKGDVVFERSNYSQSISAAFKNLLGK